MKYTAFWEADAVSVGKGPMPKTELAMKAVNVMIHESALYQSIILESGSKEECQRILNCIIDKGMFGDIHPIIISQAALLLTTITPAGLLATNAGGLSHLAT